MNKEIQTSTKAKTVIPRADIYLFLVTFIWGSTFTVTKNALSDVSPLMMQGTRFLLAFILVGAWTFKDIKQTTKKSLRAGIILGLLLGLGFALQTVGLKLTSASKAGFFTGTLVVLTPLLQIIIERRLPSIGNAIGVVLVSIGIYLFSAPGGEPLNTGDFLVLACALVFALYVVLLDVYTKEKFDREIVFYQFLVTSVMGFLLSPLLEEPLFTPTDEVIISIVYLSIFASCIALFVQSKYQRETTPTKAAIIFTMEPIVAAIIAYFVLGEILGPMALTGAAIMITGLFVSEIYTAMKARRSSRS